MKEITTIELKKIQISLLDEIDSYCKKHKLTYYLIGGTLIGAARHKGYIPWDDDIDIAMLRKDYETFMRHFNKKHTTMRAINHDLDKNYYLQFGKVIDTRTSLHENISSKYSIGVYVDVFPIDNVPDDNSIYENQYKKSLRYQKLLLFKNLPYKKRNFSKTLLFICAKVVSFPFTRHFLIEHINAISQKYNNQNTQRLGKISSCIYKKGAYTQVWPREDFAKTTELNFEGSKYSCPINYDHMLKITFGDYMKVPAKVDQEPHHDFEVSWK